MYREMNQGASSRRGKGEQVQKEESGRGNREQVQGKETGSKYKERINGASTDREIRDELQAELNFQTSFKCRFSYYVAVMFVKYMSLIIIPHAPHHRLYHATRTVSHVCCPQMKQGFIEI